jgi:hypothetical protein
MKNIHLLPTENPSRLILQGSELVLSKYMEVNEGFSEFNQHICITSDVEIKEGDYFWKPDCNMIFKAEYTPHKGCQKVILTSDQDLINDGVQAIDGEFLEWFVKNPTCEIVEIKPLMSNNGRALFGYNVVIPIEEPKQIYYNTVGIENGVNVVKGQFNTQKEALDLANELNRKFPDLYYDWRETLIKEEPKQERFS